MTAIALLLIAISILLMAAKIAHAVDNVAKIIKALYEED